MGKTKELVIELDEQETDLLEEGEEAGITLTHKLYTSVFNKERNRYDIVTIEFNPDYPDVMHRMTREQTNYDEKAMCERAIKAKYVEDETQNKNRELDRLSKK